MVSRKKILIHASPEEVWQLIENPLKVKSWNARFRQIVPVSLGDTRYAGFQFRAQYAHYNVQGNFQAEFLEYETGKRLVIHMKGGNLPVKAYLQEVYELAETGNGTVVTLRTYIEQVSTSTHFCLLMNGFLHVGRSYEKRCLLRLKELAERTI